MLELTKITYDQQHKLHEWLTSLVSHEHYAALEKTFIEIVKGHCDSQKSNIVIVNEQFKRDILPQLQFAIDNYLEKNAIQKIITASLSPLPQLQLDGLTTTALFYQALNNYEYATTKIPKLSHLPEMVQVRRSLTTEQQIRIDLIKRIVSLWRATEIALGSMLNEKMKKHFLDHIMAVQNLPAVKLTSLNVLQKITNKYLQSLSWTIAEIIANKLRIQIIEAQKLLSKMEGLANWERPRVCTVSVIPMEVAEKKYHHLQIDSPLKMQLTPDQQQEYARITEENVVNQPLWFRSLHPLEKQWLIENKQNIISGKFNCPSSLTRHLPGVTNFSEFTDLIADENDQTISLHTSIRRHTLSVTVKNANENQRLTRQNGEQLFACAKPKERFSAFWGKTLASELKILFLDLGALTPLNTGAASIIDLVPYQENNTHMQNANEAAIDHLASTVSNNVTVLGTNIAVNTEREYSENFIEYSFRQVSLKLNTYISNLCYHLSLQISPPSVLKEALKHLQLLFVNPKPDLHELSYAIKSLKRQQAEITAVFFAGNHRKANRFILAFEALHDYLYITTNHARIDDANNKALFAAALLQVTVSHLGGTVTGGCKSAKDRWGTVLMHTSAMLAYYNKYRELPKVTDQGDTRAKFVHEFKTVFLAGHQQHMASVNIYGANGTLDGTNPPTRVLQKMGMEFIPMVPHDIQKAIGKERIDTHQMFANSSKWRYRDPISPWKLFLNDLSNIFHFITCGVFRKAAPASSVSVENKGVKSKGSLAKLAKLGGPTVSSSLPELRSAAPISIPSQAGVSNIQSVFQLAATTPATNASVLPDTSLNLRP